MCVMGLDAGDKHIGAAVSDGAGLTAHGPKTIDRNGCIKALKEIIEEYELKLIPDPNK